MKNLLKDFVDMLYPATCPGCGMVYAKGEDQLCLSCELEIPFFRNETYIEHILGGRVPVKAAAIYLKFYAGGLTQRLLHEIKYRGNRNLGRYLGERFMQSGNHQERFADIDVIIPIPLHEEKLRQRGYNQSELIAEGIGISLARSVNTTAVQRISKSETQTRKSRQDRWQNVDGIFACKHESIAGKNVLLIDDVITTGATMEACAQEILKSGAKSISFAALAMAMK